MSPLALPLLVACHPTGAGATGADTSSGPTTPEEVVATASPGDAVSFEGSVFALTFDSTTNNDTGIPDDEKAGGYDPSPDRWLLVRTVRPDGVTRDELDGQALLGDPDEALVATAWGLGVHLDPDAPRPRIGSTVQVTGTYQPGDWNGHTGLPMVEDAQVDVVDADVGAAEGASCTRDADCVDTLVCDRTTSTCAATPEEIHWGSSWHDVNGACDTDDDCPLGQVCDTAYTIQSSGDYTAHYLPDTDVGRSLCVPADASDPAAACGAIASAADLEGGRWIQGHETCVEGDVLVYTHANDGDIHIQLTVDEPLVYPAADVPASDAGATTEVSPPYEDPDRPEGPLEPPSSGQHIVVLGTYRWDDGHGWFEVHPVKAWWPAE